MHEIEYDVTADDLKVRVAAEMATPACRAALRRQYWTLMVVAPIIFVLTLILTRRVEWTDLRVLSAFACAVAAGGAMHLYWRSFQQSIVKEYVSTWVRAATGRHRMRIDESGVHEIQPSGSSSHNWQNVEEAKDSPHHIFLNVGPHGWYIIPKRAFGSAEEASLLLSEINRLRGLGKT